MEPIPGSKRNASQSRPAPRRVGRDGAGADGGRPGLASAASTVIRRRNGNGFGFSVQHDLRNAVFRHVQALDIGYAGASQGNGEQGEGWKRALASGEVISRSTADITLLQILLSQLHVLIGSLIFDPKGVTMTALPRLRSPRSLLPVWLRAAALALAGAFALAADARAAEPDLSGVSLTIGIQSSGNSIATALLEASGVFADTPYKLTWANFDGANAAVEALHAGAIDVDVGLNFSTPVLNQANASRPWTVDDRPYVIVGANLQLNRAGTAIIVRPNAGIASVKDLAGKTASFAKGTANHYFFAIAAEKAGLDLASVNLALMPLSEARAAFVGGSVDALVTAVSNARPLITSGDGVVLATSEGLYDNYSWFVARPEVLKDPAREAAVADILVRLQKAAVWQSQNLDKVTEIFAKAGRQKPQDAALNAAESITVYVPIDAGVIAANQSQAEVFHKAGVATTAIDAAIGFDDRFNAVIAANPGPQSAEAQRGGSTN
ncbi:ABC transporter substrate-binding protein [Pseudochelatococcus sp. B33]